MSRLKTILSKIYHIRALKYIVVVVIGIAVVGFVDENSIWHHFTNKQRISELQDEIDMYIRTIRLRFVNWIATLRLSRR